MKNSNKLLHYLVLLMLFSCQKEIKFKPNNNYPKVFDINKLVDIDKELNNFYKFDSSSIYYKILENSFNFYDLYFYSNIKDGLFVVYHDYDYDRTFTIISRGKNQIVDSIYFYDIACISGDGGDFYYKKSVYKNNLFYSSFVGGERYFTTPKDTILYRLKGKSIIKILPNGKIIEDTIEVKRDFMEIVPERYIIEDNF